MPRLALLCLIAAASTAIAEPAVIYAPFSVADNIASVEATKLDIGEPQAAFDGDPHTLIRTPAINPAFVRVEFKKPVSCEAIRLRLIDARHAWSIAVADNARDLERKQGSYRVLAADRVTEGPVAQLKLDKSTSFKTLEFNVTRQTGDDYVHVSEIEFCLPQRVEGLRIERITDRRQADAAEGRERVDGPITKAVQTVVAFKAYAVVGDTLMDVTNDATWEALTAGVEPFGDKPGEFAITDSGKQTLKVSHGDTEQTVTLGGKRRRIKNRKDDVEILFIHRTPEMDYDGPNSGLPTEGQDVVWQAHVYNWGRKPVEVGYEWRLDDAVVGKGTAAIPAGPPSNEATLIEQPWKWTQKRCDLTLKLTPPADYEDLVPANNTLTVQTNAITVGLWVEQSLWDHHHEHQWRLPTHDANSFAGWGQRMVRKWNGMFEDARYEIYPDGVTERVRLDKVVIVPDFALPLHGGLPSNNPDLTDKTVDMTWGCESNEVEPGWEAPEGHWWSPERAIKAIEDGRVAARKEDPPFWCGLGYIHEMSHARYLIDAYGFNVHVGQSDDLSQRLLRVTDEEGPIIGRYIPRKLDLIHWRKYAGQMGGDYWSWSPFEAMCWNRVAGRRARGGNCNSPAVIGEFLNDIPAKLVYEFVDDKGRPLSNAEICVYQALGTGKDWYTKRYEDEPALKKTLDAEGRVTFDRTMWSPDGKITHTYGHSNSVVLWRVTYKDQHYYLFEEVTDANIAYNLGQKDECVLKRQIKLRSGAPDPSEWNADQNWDPSGAGYAKRPADYEPGDAVR